MKFRDLLSWDLYAAIAATAVAWWLLPSWPTNALAKDLYGLGVTVLSIVFAVFFTALAVIMTGGGDEFVAFLRQTKVYDGIMASFQFTLVILFIALLYAVCGFAATAVASASDDGWAKQAAVFLVAFSFLFFYGLFSVIDATNDAILWSRYRGKFFDAKSDAAQSPPPEQAPRPTGKG